MDGQKDETLRYTYHRHLKPNNTILMSQINIGNKSYVTKAFARDLLGYANTNSIDHLIRSGKLSVFQSTVLGRKFLCLDEVKKLSRLHRVSK